MHLIYNNVNDAFVNICKGFRDGGFWSHDHTISSDQRERFTCHHPPLFREPSRYGSVIRIAEPVTITYEEPLKRVLFHSIRDCNPFFHLIEALWMLAGRCDVGLLSKIVKKIDSFVDDDLTLGDIPYKGMPRTATEMSGRYMWGAYGYRWRNWFVIDQLETAIQILKKDNHTRRVVLQMWEPRDLHRVLGYPACKDVPCNTEVMFLPRHEDDKIFLDMTVINRSNDMLWGALGSNYVTFSVLLEYVAVSAGYLPGRYHQMSNNLHVYVETLHDTTQEVWSGKWKPDELCIDLPHCYDGEYNHYPLFMRGDKQTFDSACHDLFENNLFSVGSSFFAEVVVPMLMTHQAHKQKDHVRALTHTAKIVPLDWRVACEQWIKRRQ